MVTASGWGPGGMGSNPRIDTECSQLIKRLGMRCHICVTIAHERTCLDCLSILLCSIKKQTRNKTKKAYTLKKRTSLT